MSNLSQHRRSLRRMAAQADDLLSLAMISAADQLGDERAASLSSDAIAASDAMTNAMRGYAAAIETTGACAEACRKAAIFCGSAGTVARQLAMAGQPIKGGAEAIDQARKAGIFPTADQADARRKAADEALREAQRNEASFSAALFGSIKRAEQAARELEQLVCRTLHEERILAEQAEARAAAARPLRNLGGGGINAPMKRRVEAAVAALARCQAPEPVMTAAQVAAFEAEQRAARVAEGVAQLAALMAAFEAGEAAL